MMNNKYFIFFLFIVLFVCSASALDWYADDCYKLTDYVIAGTNVSVYSNITLGSESVNYSVLFNNSEVCRYDYVFNGTNICDVNTLGMYGNYSIECNFSDSVNNFTVPDRWLFVDTTTTTSTTLTTTTIMFYGNLTLILVNDSFNYNLCYDNLNNCYNKSESKLIDKDYMLYIIPEKQDILNFNYVVFFLTILFFGVIILAFISIMFTLLIFVGSLIFKK